MTLDPGAVVIRAWLREGTLREVEVRSARPSIASGFAGRPATELQTLLPLVFSICGRAHAAAIGAALAAARGATAAHTIDPAAAAEAARELLFSVSTDESRPILVRAQRSLADRPAFARLLSSEWVGGALEGFLALQDLESLRAWAAAGAAPLCAETLRRLAWSEPPAAAVGVFAPIDAAETLEIPALDAAFAAAPVWRGGAAETGPVVRRREDRLIRAAAGRPLLQRWLARVGELVEFARGESSALLGQVSATSPRPGVGRGMVHTARGILLHEVVLAREVVQSCVLVAPTEWNFHPDGALARWLTGRAVESVAAAHEWIDRAALALDACVAYRVEVR